MMTQFLRLRVAFSSLRGELAEKETTQKLRERIAAGEKIEVGGFLLAPELAMAIDRIDLANCRPPLDLVIHWVDTGKGDIAPRVKNTLDQWRAMKACISYTQVDVKPYWVHTRGEVPEYGPLADEVARIFEERLR